LISGLYLLANLGASFHISVRYGWRHLQFLPLIFAILHLGYGYGFLLGLLRFISRWNDTVIRSPVLSHEIKTRPVVPPAD
jgi:hypothetical protein